MPARYRRSYSRRRGPRRKVIWGTFFGQAQPLAAAATTNESLLAGLLVGGVGIVGGTVIRTHVSLTVRSLDTDSSPAVIWGLIVADPANNIPIPQSDFYADWVMLHCLTPGTADSAIADPVNAPVAEVWGRIYDVRSRRRIHEMNDKYWFSISNAGSAAVAWTVFVRSLVALP